MKDSHSPSRRYSDTKFLYVDDEADNLSSFRVNLEEEFEILTTERPLEALDIIRAEPNLAVLVVDQVMPKLTGLQLAIEAKKLKPTLTCVMITGNATKKLAVESVRTRVFWEFLEKPVNFAAKEVRQMMIGAIQEHLLTKTKLEYHAGTVDLLARLIDDKDGHTARHSHRVTEWAVKIAQKFDFTERELVMIREGALIHDIGKVSIPDDILKKPGRLTDLERKVIMSHPGRGGDLLDAVPQLRELSPMARCHHERPDGKGYPNGLKGEEIPLMVSIVALADFFEALSAKRPYKDPWQIQDIVQEVWKVRGTQFSHEVVDALLAVIEEEGLIDHGEVMKICA